jgi:hypothetical protein
VSWHIHNKISTGEQDRVVSHVCCGAPKSIGIFASSTTLLERSACFSCVVVSFPEN